jgi:hypothetical protein
MATEQFGTNMRATVAVSLPNVVRAMIVPFSLLLTFIKPEYGILWSLGVIALACMVMAMGALFFLQETFAKSLDFVEEY